MNNEQIKLRARFTSNIGVGLIIVAMVLPILPQERPWWTLAAIMAGLGIVGFACIAWAIWYVGKVRP
jgi:multisubunit Na+/H+ antiporter MnhB subunit